MSVEERKRRIRSITEAVYHQGDLEALEELYTPDVIYHQLPFPDIEGWEELKALMADIRRTFSDVQFNMEKIILEGDTHAGTWTLWGRHTGRSPSMPVPPTGKEVTIVGCSIAHWKGDRIDEEWNYVDWLGFFQQLGVIPPMG